MMKAFYRTGWLVARIFLRVMYGLKIVDEPKIPRTGPVIVASNHQSYFDPPALGSSISREMHFFAKKELFDVLVLGWLIRHFNSIPVRRGVYDPASLNRVAEALEAGGGLIMFPEGTRGDGKTLMEPKPGIGMIAKRSRPSIVPAYISGTDNLGKAFWRRPRARLTFGDPMKPEEIDGFEDNKDGYRALARAVMERIGQLKRSVAIE